MDGGRSLAAHGELSSLHTYLRLKCLGTIITERKRECFLLTRLYSHDNNIVSKRGKGSAGIFHIAHFVSDSGSGILDIEVAIIKPSSISTEGERRARLIIKIQLHIAQR